MLTQTDPHPVSEAFVVAAPPCTQRTATCCSARSLSYYPDCAENFLQHKEALSPEAWKEFRKRSGSSFVDTCLKIHKWYNSLSDFVQNELRTIPFPSYLPLAVVVNLSKVSAEALLECSVQLKIRADEQGYLDAKDVSAIAKLFQVKPKRYFLLEEEMTLEGWQLIAKKYKLKKPGQLEIIQQTAQQLALHETVFGHHVVKALLELGYDPLLVLPKLKKQYTEKDLDIVVEKAVEPLRLENTVLKERIQELEQSKGNQVVNLIQESVTQVEEPSIQTEEPEVEDSELEVLLSVIEPVEIVSTAPEIDNSETLPKITSLKDLKGYQIIIDDEGTEKRGIFCCQNGTGHTGQVKTLPDGLVYTRDLSEIQVEYPCGSEQYHDLAGLKEAHGWIVEERSAEQIRHEIEEKKAQREVKTSPKGFGSSSKNQPSAPYKSLNSKGFAPSPMGKRAGAR